MAWEEANYPILKDGKPYSANRGNIQGHNITDFGPETIWQQAERVNWRKNYFDKQREQKALRRINTLGLNKVPWHSGESYQSPLGTQASMKVEPEWYHQRGQEVPARMITQPIMDLYQDEESDYYYNQGGIASTRPGYAWAGPVIKDQGFDTSGGETWQQAKTVSPTDPDVYRKGSFFGLGSKLTGGGEDINRAVEDYQTWNRRYGSQLGEDEKLDIYKQNFHLYNPEKMEREFYKKYPYSYDLGFTINDLDEQRLLPEDAPKGYFDLAGGGIASLENRPGYAFAGIVDQNASPWITRKSDQNWITKKQPEYTGDNPFWKPWHGTQRWSDSEYEAGEFATPNQPSINKWITRKNDFIEQPDLDERKPDQNWITRKHIENLEEEENQWIQRKAEGGGIASTRPGYWGGGALSALGKRLSDRKALDFAGAPVDMPDRTLNKPSWGEMADTYSKYNKGWNNPVSNFMKKHGRSILFANPISNAIGRWNRISGMGGPSDEPIYGKLYEDQIGTGSNPLKATGMTDDEIEEWYQKQDYNEGGAVGLEPGIGSLMGYAKGGMVTKVEVPKGQSKWMKRFMNSMRGS